MARKTDTRATVPAPKVKRITVADGLFVAGAVSLGVSGFALSLFAGLLSMGAALVIAGIGAELVQRADGDTRQTTRHQK